METDRRKFMMLSSSVVVSLLACIQRVSAASNSDAAHKPVPQRQPGIAELPFHLQIMDMMKLKNRIKAISNVFEVGDQQADYSYIEDLDYGRGLTVTSYGFCTCNSEVTDIIKFYDPLAPGNGLGPFLPFLPPAQESLTKERFAEFSNVWGEETKLSNILREVCEKYADQLYFDPAVKFAKEAKISTPIGVSIIYDTLLQHGGGDDEDSLSAIYQRTVAQTGWPHVGSEADFLRAMLEMRRADLTNPQNTDTAEVWRESVPRIDALLELLKSNPELQPPLHVRNEEVSVTIL